MNRIFRRYLSAVFICFLVFYCYGVSIGQENTSPIQIEADRMESKQQSNTVIFSGKVEAKQGDLFIRADDMEVKYQAQGKKGAKASGKSPKISKIVAKGNIEIRNQGWVASGDALEFFEQERKVLLTGNAKVWQDNNMVTGERILLYLDEGKSVIEKSGKKGERVKAFFYPQAENRGQGTGNRGQNPGSE